MVGEDLSQLGLYLRATEHLASIEPDHQPVVGHWSRHGGGIG
jgi:hypothetical protein